MLNMSMALMMKLLGHLGAVGSAAAFALAAVLALASVVATLATTLTLAIILAFTGMLAGVLIHCALGKRRFAHLYHGCGAGCRGCCLHRCCTAQHSGHCRGNHQGLH